MLLVFLVMMVVVVVAARIRYNRIRDARIKIGRRARLTHRSVDCGKWGPLLLLSLLN